MKKIKLLAEHFGEFQYTTKSPVREYNPEMDEKLLTEKTTALYSSDMWEPVTVNKYEVQEHILPDWCDVNYYIHNIVYFKWYFGFGAKYEWPKQWYERLNSLEEYMRYACIKLLNTNCRSPFKQSLKNQLTLWLNAETILYKHPFSPKQCGCVLDKWALQEAKSISETLYWSR